MEFEFTRNKISCQLNNGLGCYLNLSRLVVGIYKENKEYMDLGLFPAPSEPSHHYYWCFSPIPWDLEFWDHALWVTRNPELIKRLIPSIIEIQGDEQNGYFTDYVLLRMVGLDRNSRNWGIHHEN